MGASAGFLALLLVLLDIFLPVEPGLRDARVVGDPILQVLIRRRAMPAPIDAEKLDLQTPPTRRAEGPAVEAVADDRIVEITTPSEAPAAPRSPIDWSAEIVESVAALQSERRANETTRQSMWLQSRSVMFAPEDEFTPSAEGPVLADLRFRPEIHVAGIGLTIGSCFVGLPLIGVPVEQRTVAIRLFVCADGSG